MFRRPKYPSQQRTSNPRKEKGNLLANPPRYIRKPRIILCLHTCPLKRLLPILRALPMHLVMTRRQPLILQIDLPRILKVMDRLLNSLGT
jgi:hypothetical protein